eukprot:91501_1
MHYTTLIMFFMMKIIASEIEIQNKSGHILCHMDNKEFNLYFGYHDLDCRQISLDQLQNITKAKVPYINYYSEEQIIQIVGIICNLSTETEDSFTSTQYMECVNELSSFVQVPDVLGLSKPSWSTSSSEWYVGQLPNGHCSNELPKCC